MAHKTIAGWAIPDDDRAALETVPPPIDISFDPHAKDISYPHCNSWSTGRQCVGDGGLSVGTIWEERCVNADGSVTKTFTCVIEN